MALLYYFFILIVSYFVVGILFVLFNLKYIETKRKGILSLFDYFVFAMSWLLIVISISLFFKDDD